MTRQEIEHMWKVASNDPNHDTNWNDAVVIAFAELVEQHVRRAMNEEAKAHLEELRKNFNAESAELRLHQWSQEKQA